MMRFTVEPLPRGRSREVYPLIREVIPGLSLADWLRFTRGATGLRSGVMVARREGRDHPSGLFCFRVDRDPAQGKILAAEYFIALDLLDSDAVLAALVAGLDGLGRRLGCSAVRSVVHRRDVEGGLANAGHAAAGALLWKSLSA